ncbi:hypothetical protein ACHAWF_009546 [Thalassiosira exigua]
MHVTSSSDPFVVCRRSTWALRSSASTPGTHSSSSLPSFAGPLAVQVEVDFQLSLPVGQGTSSGAGLALLWLGGREGCVPSRWEEGRELHDLAEVLALDDALLVLVVADFPLPGRRRTRAGGGTSSPESTSCPARRLLRLKSTVLASSGRGYAYGANRAKRLASTPPVAPPPIPPTPPPIPPVPPLTP